MASGFRDFAMVFATRMVVMLTSLATQSCLAWVLMPAGRGHGDVGVVPREQHHPGRGLHAPQRPEPEGDVAVPARRLSRGGRRVPPPPGESAPRSRTSGRRAAVGTGLGIRRRAGGKAAGRQALQRYFARRGPQDSLRPGAAGKP